LKVLGIPPVETRKDYFFRASVFVEVKVVHLRSDVEGWFGECPPQERGNGR
jgi:hypothetical protein